jgi:hypothetical protein
MGAWRSGSTGRSVVTAGAWLLSNLAGGIVPLQEGAQMRSDTQSVTIAVAPGQVLSFVADGANLPRWAIGFAKSVRPDEAGWLVSTAQGEMPVTIAADKRTGTVDFRMEPAPGLVATAYGRVIPSGEGAEFVFTQFQQPGVSDEVFGQLAAAAGHELVALKALLEVECPL